MELHSQVWSLWTGSDDLYHLQNIPVEDKISSQYIVDDYLVNHTWGDTSHMSRIE
jgi:hypothetical protein